MITKDLLEIDDGKEDLIIELDGKPHITIHPAAYLQWGFSYEDCKSLDKMLELLLREILLISALKGMTNETNT